MIEIIPAIDIIDGKCVRLTQGDYTQKKIYNEDPLEAAKQFEAVGIKRLHLVDLDGAKAGRVVNIKILEMISSRTDLVIDFGGGIKQDTDIKMVFEAGAALATIGSVAVKEPEVFIEWIKQYGANKIMLGADVKNEMIAVNGWQEVTSISVFDFIAINKIMGIKSIFCTDISKDGKLEGPAIELYKQIIAHEPGIKLIASGGVSSIKDIKDLEAIGCKGVIIGKAIYEGRFELDELKIFID